MEVGPARPHAGRLRLGQRRGARRSVDGALKQLDVPVTALFSTLGRTAARGIETQLVARWAKEFYDAAPRQHQERRHPHRQHREVGALDLAGRRPRASA